VTISQTIIAGVAALLAASSCVLGGEYHLTARPWKPLGTPPSRSLDVIEGECRFTTRLQNSAGAIIDPFIHREHQYATPYFAYAAGTLVDAGRAKDLPPSDQGCARWISTVLTCRRRSGTRGVSG